MKRLALILAIALGLLLAPLAANAQPPGKASRIGFLVQWRGGLSLEPFAKGLRELGYLPYMNVTFEIPVAGRDRMLLDTVAAELVRLKPDIIVADST